MQKDYILFLVILSAIVSCGHPTDSKLFEIRKGGELGIDFENTITTNDTLNAVSFEYVYNGSGVGVGDFNNDGLQDIFFGGNQVSSQLYLNNGNLKFINSTEESGISTRHWITGVSVVDINTDGLQDIYLCVAGQVPAEQRKNLLFINQGIKEGTPTFVESAASYGLDDDRYATMAAFFDYDKDGDIDLYLVNNWLERYNRNNLRPKRSKGEAESTDRLYRNNGNNTFTNASDEAGITIEGYGLGVAICDINQDSWPDVYVANDFLSNDLIWVNQQNGTFQNKAGDYLKHQTHNGMGVDIADFNNDALPDILVVDMLPPDHKRQKLMTAGQNYDHFNLSIKLGYEPQYMRNTLQLNRGKDDSGNVLYSEIAFMAGVAKTDWSWAPLFADFDNDGWKDIFIGTGYRKDVTNLDFVFFGTEEGSPFGTTETRSKNYAAELDKLEEVKTTNHVFRNTGSLIFEDKTKDWGMELPTYSNGSAYADFDNDGDLDLVTNNIDQEVVLYENLANKKNDKHHYIRFRATNGFNHKIWVYTGGVSQFQEFTPFRGFQSSVENYVHFGLGKHPTIDSILIEWPDGHYSRYENLNSDTVLVLSDTAPKKVFRSDMAQAPSLLRKISPVRYSHLETSEPDIKITRTLLHELSRYGPCVTSGDVNGDGLDDFFLGGEVGVASRLFFQERDGTFKPTRFNSDSTREDGGALFFDADNDGDLDLYIGAASPSATMSPGKHLLYLNDGKGRFSVSDRLPDITTSASCLKSSDFDKDGDIDLFVAGRISPGKYPLSPRSYILRNDGGKFTDVTVQLNYDLQYPGMISSALWLDVDNDTRKDLVLAGEWMPIRIFRNTGTSFVEITTEMGLAQTTGWWNCLVAGDMNHDGYPEIIAGNTGKNSYFQPTSEHPVQLVAKDFDNNGSIDPIVTYYNEPDKDRYMVHNRLVLIDQIPGTKKRFETFAQFATTPFNKAFTEEELDGAYISNAVVLSSVMLINDKGKRMNKADLPEICQVSTINDGLIDDLNEDGHNDIILIGNNYAQETLFGRYDASIGTVLLGDGKLNWKAYEPTVGKFISDGDAKHILSLQTASGLLLVVANNNGPLEFYKKLYELPR
ncbi:MAG TPA: VCBS repeat-containing protein [Chryseolinea sp.]